MARRAFCRKTMIALFVSTVCTYDRTGSRRGFISVRVDDTDLRAALSAIEPRGRDLLRRYLIADQSDRDALASRLLNEGTEHARWLANLIDTLTMYPDQRRRAVRLLGGLAPLDDGS
jgi:hypothetical protein